MSDPPPPGPPDPAEERPPAAAPGVGAADIGVTGTWALFLTTFLIATCGLVYELVAGAMASYLLGDSITQFSLVIGTYLSAMGLGSYLSRYVKGDLLTIFLRVEVVVGLLGGSSAALLFASYSYLETVRPVLFALVAVVGTLVGLEIPVLMRLLRDQVAFSDLVARVLAFDYVGALAASVLFPLLLVPALGIVRTSFLFGLVNTVVALGLTWLFAPQLGRRRHALRVQAVVSSALLVAGFAAAEQVARAAEQDIYEAPILIKRKTPYQQIVVTRWRDDVRLYLNGSLQFSSRDEHRYHEALVHPGAALVGPGLRSALVLGGGDGMALRELLRYPALERATLVDLDPEITRLFADEPMLRALNGDSYHDPRVRVVNADAMKWLEEVDDVFDLVVIDLPDPSNYNVSKLYTRGMYRLVLRHLSRSGALAVQATNPRVAPRSFWCIERTIADAGLATYPYHAHVPSFGDWGFVLAAPTRRPAPERLAAALPGLRFLNDRVLGALFALPEDLKPPGEVEVNRLEDQVLVGYYADEWSRAN